MKRITFSADAGLIERARAAARDRGTTISVAFREWLRQHSGRSAASAKYLALMKQLKHVKSGGKYTRDEMNER